MKAATAAVVLAIVVFGTTSGLLAFGQIVVYCGVVDSVLFEPTERNPTRVQLWGAFAPIRQTPNWEPVSVPEEGYLYFQVSPTATPLQVKSEIQQWRILSANAGQGTVICFGRRFLYPKLIVHKATVGSATVIPADYRVNTQLVRFPEERASLRELSAALRMRGR